jgi:hypothetical protein
MLLLSVGRATAEPCTNSVACDVSAWDGINAEALITGPFVSYKLTPNVTVGARAAWSGANDAASFDANSASFATDMALTQAEITGNWGLGKWQLMQTMAVTYVDEGASARAGDLGDSSGSVTRFTTGPEIKRAIDTGFGNSVEPFAFFKTSLELDDPRIRAGVARNTLGGGLMLSKPESYNLRATAERSAVVGIGEMPETELAGKVFLSVPLQ